MKWILCTYLLIVCVNCDTKIKEYGKIIEDKGELQDGTTKSSTNEPIVKDLETLNKKNEYGVLLEILENNSQLLKKNITESDLSNTTTEKHIPSSRNDLKEPSRVHGDKSNSTEDKGLEIEKTSKSRRVHYRKHHSYIRYRVHTHSCRHEKSRRNRRRCYKINRDSMRQRKLAKILYPNGIPLKAIPIEIPKETNLSFPRVIKARKAHDKKMKTLLKKLGKIRQHDRRRQHRQQRRFKIIQDIKNTTTY